MKTIQLYESLKIGREEFTRNLFSLYSKELGFEIIEIKKRFPDCIAIDKRNNRNQKVAIELEEKAENFFKHGHDKHINNLDLDCLVVCWDDSGSELLKQLNIEVICLRKLKTIKFEFINEPIIEYDSSEVEPEYLIMFYKSSQAEGTINYYQDLKVFRTNSFNNRKRDIPKNSKILLREDKQFIAEFTVQKFVRIEEKPKTEYEKKIYDLISYPIGSSENPNLDLDSDWCKGHLIYSSLRIFDPPIPLKNIKIFNTRNLSHGSPMVLTRKEYLGIFSK